MKVLVKTKDLSRDEWLKYRTKGIGGSDVSIIAGINPYKSVYQLWLEKTGKLMPEQTDSEFAHFGTLLEPIVFMAFIEVISFKSATVIDIIILVMNMKYILNEFHLNVTNEEILADMVKVANELNKPSITIYDYDNKGGKFNSTTVMRHFGSWNKALSQAKLPINQTFWNKTDLFVNLENAWIKKGKQPSRRDMDNKNLSNISSGAYLRAFGKWSVALAEFVEYINGISETPLYENMKFEGNNSHNTARDVNLRLRFIVMKRDNFKCCKCGRSPSTTLGLELHIDHIVPWSKGGETTIDNLQTLCSDCNLGKNNLSETE